MGIALAFKLVLFSGIINNVSYNQFACTCFQCNVPDSIDPLYVAHRRVLSVESVLVDDEPYFVLI